MSSFRTRSVNLRLALAGVLVVCFATMALAQEFPNRSIRVILPNSPGSLVDTTARILTEKMSKDLGQPMVIENLAGAAGVPGTQQLVRASKDGHTIGMVSTNHAINPGLYNLPYDAYADVAPVMLIGNTPMVLAVHPGRVPATTLKEVIALAKSRPGTLTVGSAGVGTTVHLCGELMQTMTDTKWLHVPYKGMSGATADLLGGQIDAGFFAVTVVAPLLKSGKLRAIAVTTPTRSPILPDVPTFAEAGVPGYAIDVWVMMLAPAGTPRPVLDRLHDSAAKALASKDVQEKLAEQGIDVVASSIDDANVILKNDLAKYAKIIRDAGIKSN